MSSQFVHLRLHSEFSLVDGLVRLKPLIKQVDALGQLAVALTDETNIYGLVKFYNASLGGGIKPIMGSDVWIESEAVEQPFRLTLLAMNEKGYRNITEIISKAYTDGQKTGKAIVQESWLLAQTEGIICLTGAIQGALGQLLINDSETEAKDWLTLYKSHFPDRLYIELQRVDKPNEGLYIQKACDIAAELQVPLVATNDVRFLSKDDFEAHEARVCIHDGVTLEDPRRERKYTPEQYLKSTEEMQALFADIPEAITNTVEIAKRCSLQVQLGKYFLPDFPIPDGMTIDEFFAKVSEEGLEERLEIILPEGCEDRDAKRKLFFDRLKFELDIICQMGFPGYFLIVMDFIQWAKNNDIPVGPGRGSGAGSLVAYALKITDLDPLEYDLLFERFLNPERVSMPDFDIDFCMDNRDQVISYVADTYGRDAVSQIVTFGTMAAKAVVRDVARVLGKPYGLADKLSKLIPFEIGITLPKAIEQEEQLSDFVKHDADAQEIWEMALSLEGLTRNVGKHAGGVVIAPTKLTDFSALYCDENGDGLVTQFDKNDVESAGLVKFDFLGLRTLTIIDWALKMINPRKIRDGEEPIDIAQIPLEDEAVYKLLQEGRTTAVFQLESRGMKELLLKLLPSNFEDIIALVALYRPGPLGSGMVDDFIECKHGRQAVVYPHPDLEPVLDTTYGVILYQEQVMLIAQVLAQFTLGGADMLRRAMGKKKPEEMVKMRAMFNEGCAKNNIPEEKATEIFDLMEYFAGYGFNKSHSAAYALVSYQTAWLKQHYPEAFMAAVMSSDLQNTDKIVNFIDDCRAHNLTIVPPDVNLGEYKFTIDEDNRIIYGLGAVKGVGEGPVDAILEGRKDGPFTDMFDFCKRCDLKRLNKRSLEALIKAGAFDSIGPSRAVMEASLAEAIKTAEQDKRNAQTGMMDMFSVQEEEEKTDPYLPFMNAIEWSDRKRLAGEKETLGLYLTGHPIDAYRAEISRVVKTPISQLRTDKKYQWLAGQVFGMRTMKNKRGDTLCFLTLDDGTARIDVTLFSNVYEEFREQIVKDEVVLVEGEVSEDTFSGGIKVRASKVMQVEEARRNWIDAIGITVSAAQFQDTFKKLQPMFTNQPSDSKVEIVYDNATAQGSIRLDENYRLPVTDEVFHQLKQVLGEDNFHIKYVA